MTTKPRTLSVEVFGASGENVPQLAITSQGHVPEIPCEDLQRWERDVYEMYRKQGERIVQAMRHCLPGGTIDHVMIALMQSRASMFRVPFKGNKDADDD